MSTRQTSGGKAAPKSRAASPAVSRAEKTSWHTLPADEVLARLGSAAAGLSAAEAARRLATNGPNELVEAQRINPSQIFFRQFKSLIIWILIAAGIISGLLGEAIDAGAILAIVVLNAFIGFYQEFNAEKSIAALKKMTAPQAKVRRAGHLVSLPTSQVVDGDIIELEAGDLVAADARLLKATSLKTMEATLTGESEAVAKKAVVAWGTTSHWAIAETWFLRERASPPDRRTRSWSRRP